MSCLNVRPEDFQFETLSDVLKPPTIYTRYPKQPFWMDVWWNNHFLCNDLESSSWNNHKKNWLFGVPGIHPRSATRLDLPRFFPWQPIGYPGLGSRFDDTLGTCLQWWTGSYRRALRVWRIIGLGEWGCPSFHAWFGWWLHFLGWLVWLYKGWRFLPNYIGSIVNHR